MAEQGDVKGDGFEILGHKAPEAAGQQAGAAEPGEPHPAPEPGPEVPEPGADAAGPRPGEEPPKQDVYLLLQMAVMQFASLAWQKMGLQADPFTNQVERDLTQAKVAIDAAGALLDHLLPHLQGQQARDYQTLLTDLRLNFVRQSGQ